MLYLDEARTIAWTTVFRDDEDPDRYYYLPNYLSFAPREDGKPNFNMIWFSSDDGKAGAVVHFEVSLAVPDTVEAELKKAIPGAFAAWRAQSEKAGRKPGKDIHLGVPRWDSGTVHCMALGTSSRAGGDKKSTKGEELDDPKRAADMDTSLRADDKGRLEFVPVIHGAASPSLDAKNTAIFGMQLSKEGAQLLLAAFENDMAPIGIMYELKYTGIAPSYRARVTADMQNIHKMLSGRLEGQWSILRGGIEGLLQEAHKKKHITVESTDYELSAEKNELLRKHVISFLTDVIVNDWMKPVLTPAEVKGKDMESLDTILERAKKLKPDKKPDDKKPDDKEPEDKKPEDKKPEDKKPEDKKPEDKKPEADKDKKDGSTFLQDLKSGLAKVAKGVISHVASVPVISFELKGAIQKEVVEVTYDLNHRTAVQRTFAPQHLLGHVLGGIKKDDKSYVVKKALNDPFFQRFEVTVDPPAKESYEKLALKSASVEIYYRGATSPSGTFVFDAKQAERRTLKLARGDDDAPSYRARMQYNFLDNQTSGWQSRLNAEGSAALTTYEAIDEQPKPRSNLVKSVVNLDPSAGLRFLDVELRAAPDFDASVLDSVHAEMRYAPGDDEGDARRAITSSFLVRKDSAAQRFRVRTGVGDPAGYTVRLAYAFKGGKTHTTGWKPGNASVLLVGEMPAVEACFDLFKLTGKVLRVLFNVAYRHDGYEFRRSNVSLSGKNLARIRDDEGGLFVIRIPVIDAAAGAYSYEVIVDEEDEDDPWSLEGEGEGGKRIVVRKPRKA